MKIDSIEWEQKQQSLDNLIRNIPFEHIAIAYKAKLTFFEIAICKEISELKRISIDLVFKKMAAFKETSEHILYKKDFIYNH